MPAPISLPQQATARKPLHIPRARDPLSILTALPFLPDLEQEWAVALFPTGTDSTDLGRELNRVLSSALAGVTVSSSHWRGARADSERASSHNLDRAFLASGLVRRLTACIPIGPDIKDWLRENKGEDADSTHRRMVHRTLVAFLHAKGRADYKIGQGMLEVAEALLPGGLLAEAERLRGHGQNRPERLLIRDAILACEDITIEEMARILANAPYQLDEKRGDASPLWDSDRIATDRTPLIFVHCEGIMQSHSGHCEVVLEAVDFQSIDILNRCLSAMRKRDTDLHKEARDILKEVYGDLPISRRGLGGRRRR